MISDTFYYFYYFQVWYFFFNFLSDIKQYAFSFLKTDAIWKFPSVIYRSKAYTILTDLPWLNFTELKARTSVLPRTFRNPDLVAFLGIWSLCFFLLGQASSCSQSTLISPVGSWQTLSSAIFLQAKVGWRLILNGLFTLDLS